MNLTAGPYRELERRWKAASRAGRNLRVRDVGVAAGYTMLCAELGDASRPTVALAAGLHGDEPAGPWALIELVESGALDARFAYRIWPCINPTGYEAGTRANESGIDINRTFGGGGGSLESRAVLDGDRGRTFVLSLDLHENCDASGFYCYEYGGGEIGRRVIAALEGGGFPIDPLEGTFDLAGPLDGGHYVRERGRIVADHAEEAALLGGLSYSLALAHDAARCALTFETPTASEWERRLAMHCMAVISAIGTLLEESGFAPCN